MKTVLLISLLVMMSMSSLMNLNQQKLNKLQQRRSPYNFNTPYRLSKLQQSTSSQNLNIPFPQFQPNSFSKYQKNEQQTIKNWSDFPSQQQSTPFNMPPSRKTVPILGGIGQKIFVQQSKLSGKLAQINTLIRENVPEVKELVLQSYSEQLIAGKKYFFDYISPSNAFVLVTIQVIQRQWENNLQIKRPNGTKIQLKINRNST